MLLLTCCTLALQLSLDERTPRETDGVLQCVVLFFHFFLFPVVLYESISAGVMVLCADVQQHADGMVSCVDI